jgi:glycosyltransferase involved in cell wall biosynthesis
MKLIKNKVSIVVPIYDMEKYLKRSLDSIIAQTYKNIEIVAVNDGSTDNSLNILKSYADKEPRIRIVEKTNGGLVDAVYAGVISATGEYICFVDPDDYVAPTFVEFFLNGFNIDNTVDAVAGGISYIDSDNRETQTLLERNAVYNSEEIKNNFLWNEENGRIKEIIFHSRCNKAYKTECVLKFIEDYHATKESSIGEDTIFTYLFLNFSKKIMACRQACGYYYYDNHTSMTNKDYRKILHDSKVTYNNIVMLAKKYGDDDRQPHFLYYCECENARKVALINRAEYNNCIKFLKQDNDYKKAIRFIIDGMEGKKRFIYCLTMKIKLSNIYPIYYRMKYRN